MGKRRRSIKKQPESPPPTASPATHAPCPVPSPVPSPVPPAPEQAPEVLVPPDWASAAAFISSDVPPPVVLVCGPANSGKSTFSRLLINSLLPRYGRVGYLDTDVGQPEFSPPGCLSVHVVDEAIADLGYPVFREAESIVIYVDEPVKQ